jgi:prepilin-type N-terminal cleavage/methylation domain-containing protein
MSTRLRPRRRHRGWTLPELITVMVLIGVAAAAFVAIPNLGRDRGSDLEAAASIDSVLTAVTTLWKASGEVTGSHTALADVYPSVRYREGEHPVGTGEVADTVSVELVPGPSGSVGVAARSGSGACLLSRMDLGDGAMPQRYAIIPRDGTTTCSGKTAMAINVREDAQAARDGSGWSSPIRLP